MAVIEVARREPAAEFRRARMLIDGEWMDSASGEVLPVENPALQAVLMALEMREAIGALTETWRRLGHEIGFGIGIAHGFATLGTIGFEGRFDYSAIGTVINTAARLCETAKDGQILVTSRIATAAAGLADVKEIGPVKFKGLSRPLAVCNLETLKVA